MPKDIKETAIDDAKSVGAFGVTIIDAEGMGLSKFDNLFLFNHKVIDIFLSFILPNHMVKKVLHSITHRVNINSGTDGIAFTFPINQLNGISLRQVDLFTEI